MKRRIIDCVIKVSIYGAFLYGFFLPVYYLKMGSITQTENMVSKSGGMVLLVITVVVMLVSLGFAVANHANKLYAHSVTTLIMGIMTFFTLMESMAHRRYGSFTVETGNAAGYMAIFTFAAMIYILAGTKRSI